LIFIWKVLRLQLSIGTVEDIQRDGVFPRSKALKDRKELIQVRKGTSDLKVLKEARAGKAGREFKVVKGTKAGKAIRAGREFKDHKDAKAGKVIRDGKGIKDLLVALKQLIIWMTQTATLLRQTSITNCFVSRTRP